MVAIHHNIVRSIKNNGAEINEYDGKFVLTHNDLGLRAVHEDAKFLRQLAADWANDENTEEYYIEDQIDEVEADEGEEEKSGSIVRDQYKAIYKERGDVNSCSDWLATHMRELTHDGNDEFMMDAFTTIAEMNGINDWHKYISPNPNSIGIMRMSVGNRIRTIVKKTGELKTPTGIIKFED